MDLRRLLAPTSVAVVGATDRTDSYGAHTLQNLAAAGYPGRVVGVNPHRDSALGVPCVPRLEDLDDPVDAVVVAAPAAVVAEQVRAAGLLGCGGVVVYADGLDAEQTAAMVAAAAQHALPVLGPNTNGLVSVASRAALWGDVASLPRSPGPVALVAQSGNVGVLALAHRAGLDLHGVVALGNAAVVDAADVVWHLARERADGRGPGALALYLEDDGDGGRLADAFAECAGVDLRIAVLKAGASSAGRAATAAHTEALAGPQRVFDALVREAGGVVVREVHELLETARALAAGRRDRRGLAVVTCSGGDAAIAADLAQVAGVPLAALTPDTRAGLRAALPSTASVTNPLDHTNMIWADRKAIADVVATVAEDDGVGHLVYVQDEPPGLPASTAGEWQITRAGAVDGAARTGVGLMLVATTPGQEPAATDVPVVSGMRPALAAVAALRRPAPDPTRLRRVSAVAASMRRQVGAGDGRCERCSVADGPVGTAVATVCSCLAEHEAKALLRTRGVPVVTGVTVSTAEAAVEAAEDLGAPAVVKVSARGLVHKTAHGAVALDLRDPTSVRTAATRLLAALDSYADPGGVLLVEPMVPPGVEVLVAARADGVVPVLVLGMGGVWAEVLDDVVVVPLPAGPERVGAALAELRGFPLLRRSGPAPVPGVAALTTLAVLVGELLVEEGWQLIELNPVEVGPDSAVAVDAVVRTGPPGNRKTLDCARTHRLS